MSLAQVLPFLAALKKSTPDFSGMTSDSAIPPQNPGPDPQAPSVYAGSPGGQGPAQQPSAPQGIGDIAQSETAGQQAPKYQETKGHLLLRLLQGGLQGGLAGMASNAQTYAQTGRNAGFGGGYQGAFQLPFTQAYERGQLAQQGAQTELLKQQAQQINVPGYGNMPAGLAKVLFPSLIRGQATVKGAELGKEGRIGAAEVGKSVVVVPGKGMYQKDANGNYQPVEGAQLPNVLVTGEEAQSLGHPELANQELPMAQYSSLLRGVSSQYATGTGAAGPAVINKRGVIQGKPGSAVSAGLGSPAMGGIAPVADPNNPGNVTYATKTAAVGAMAPQGAPTAAAKSEARSEVPTKIGDQKVAFNTMIQHAQLLRQAAAALNNGDIQALNGLKNSFKNQFGYSGPITAEAIADAYKGEVSNVINKGHITDTGNEKVAHTLDPNHQNYETIDSVLGAYQSLAQSKLNMLNQQANIAKGQPSPQTQFTVTDPAGGIHTFKDQASADSFKKAIGIK